jgi:ComF family protein
MVIENSGRRPLSALAARLLFPQRHCLMCGALAAAPGLCAVCAAQAAALPRCEICAAFVPLPGLCSACAAHKPLFTQARAAAPYAGQLRGHLLAFKYYKKTWLRRPLAALLCQTCEQHYRNLAFSAVLPAPLAPSRLKARGYNQSALLAGLLAAEFGLPQQPGLLQRVRDTPPLSSRNGEQRRALLRQAFSAGEAHGQTLLLVDDIYTSGATLNACAAVLLAAGAQAVYGLMVAGYDDRGQQPEDSGQK